MLSEFFLYSALGTGSWGNGFNTLSYPLVASKSTQATLDAEALSDKIDDEAAKVAAYDELLGAVKDFQNTLDSFDFTDETTTTDSAQALVDGYNDLLAKIETLTGKGGVLEGDTTASQLVSSLQNKLSDTFGASGSFDQLWQIGITPQPDGTLALDTDTFAAAYADDSAGVESLLTEAGAAFDAVAAPYTKGGGLIEYTADVFADNLIDLKTALPALEAMGEQTQTYANEHYATAVSNLYQWSLAESVFASYSSSLFSVEA